MAYSTGIIASLESGYSLAAEIDLSFKDWGALPLFYEVSVKILVVGGIALAIYFAFRFVLLRWLAPRSSDSTLSRKEIAEKLERALVERAKIEVSIGRDTSLGASVPCELLSFDAERIKITAPDYFKIKREMLGKRIFCFFRLKNTEQRRKWVFYRFNKDIYAGKGTKEGGNDENKGVYASHQIMTGDYGPKWLFYHFVSRIDDIQFLAEGDKVLSLDFPLEMRIRQRRRFFRIELPSSTFVELDVWPEYYAESSFEQLGKPAYLLSEKKKGSARLVDISAGGMLLEVDSYEITRTSLPLMSGGTWFVRLVLREPRIRAKYHWWLLARIVLAMKTPSGRLNLGFKFTASAADPEAGTKFRWRHLDDEMGVDGLGAWVFKRSIDIRIKGVE